MRCLPALAALIAAALAQAFPPAAERALVAERVVTLTREVRWTPAASIPVKFRTHHPQGMVKIGEALFVSSVEIKVRTRRFPEPVGGYDRDTGEGAGHLFKMDMAGNLIADLALGEGAIYHPGGIDYDGTHIWVPVAEYRPNSRSIVYRVDPATMKAAEVFRFGDHLGAIVANPDDRALHGVSWGSRRFYRWALRGDGTIDDPKRSPGEMAALNPSHYVDYQDCKYMGSRRMLCAGVTELRPASGAAPFRLGGLDLIDLRDGRPLHQVPVPLWTASGLVMTQNPVFLEPAGRGLRAYFMPEDDTSTLYVYDVDTAGRPRQLP